MTQVTRIVYTHDVTGLRKAITGVIVVDDADVIVVRTRAGWKIPINADAVVSRKS